jgi:signal transduction histidine kinase
MSAHARSVFSRRLLVALSVLGVLVLLDLALFGWLLFRSLSEREIQKVLVEARGDAETMARRLALRAEEEGGDLYRVIALEHETRTFIDSVLREREIVLKVEILDREGRLVFRSQSERKIPADPATVPEVGSPEMPHQVTTEQTVRNFDEEVTTGDLEEIQVPIGELGTIQIGLSTAELEERIRVLRGDLVARASIILVVTVAVLGGAFFGIWWLLKRARGLEEQAAEAERLAYIGTLASGLAHEIRNPLNSLSLNMQLLEEEVGPRVPSGGRLLSLTRSELSRLERLVSDFLAYARPRPLERVSLSPGPLLERVATLLLEEASQRGAQITVVDESAGASVEGDPAQLKQLLLNLALNGLAAVEGTGRLGRISLEARRAGPQVALTVADNGAGIAEEARERIFDVFFSTKKGGTGLGLAIVERITRDHGGRIEVDSTPGAGTRITVFLPALSAAAEPLPQPLAADRPARV